MKLELEKLTKDYEGHRAVDGIDMTVEDGELVVFLGHSGCGKTTTLMMVAGLIAPTSGDVRFDGKSVLQVHPKDRHVGMVFQSYALYPHMTVAENLTFALKLQGVSAHQRRKRAEEIADLLRLGQLLGRKPGDLSGGEQQRVSVGRALVKEPRLLLFDEPLSNLDAGLRMGLRSEIKRLQRRTGVTSVYVTHDQAEAMAMADRVAVIMDGKLVTMASPGELHDRPATRRIAEFIGVPAMNFFDADLQEDAGRRVAVLGAASLTLDPARTPRDGERSVVLGIRPQHLEEAVRGVACQVMSVEHLGRDLLVTVRLGATDARLYADPASQVHAGQTIRVAFDMGQAQFFDRETGASLLWNGSGPTQPSG